MRGNVFIYFQKTHHIFAGVFGVIVLNGNHVSVILWFHDHAKGESWSFQIKEYNLQRFVVNIHFNAQSPFVYVIDLGYDPVFIHHPGEGKDLVLHGTEHLFLDIFGKFDERPGLHVRFHG